MVAERGIEAPMPQHLPCNVLAKKGFHPHLIFHAGYPLVDQGAY